MKDKRIQVPKKGLIGNPVRIRDRPAAVSGDESRNEATALHQS